MTSKMNRKRPFEDLSVTEYTARSANDVLMKPPYPVFLKRLNAYCFLFGQKLKELNFTVEKYPAVQLVLDLNTDEGAQPYRSQTDIQIKDVLRVICGFPNSCVLEQNGAGIVKFISNRLRDIAPILECNDIEIIGVAESLLIAHELDAEIVLFRTSCSKYVVTLRLELVQKEVDVDSVATLGDGDFALFAAVYLDSLELASGKKQTRMLFEAMPRQAVYLFDDIVLRKNHVEFIPRVKEQSGGYIRFFREHMVPLVVPIFEA